MDALNSNEQTSSSKTQSGSMCFRISNIPDKWSVADLQQALQTFDQDLDPSKYDIFLYPACHGFGKVAILKLYETTGFFKGILPNLARYSRVEKNVLSIDCDFYGLTPLNTPSEEIIAEYVKYQCPDIVIIRLIVSLP
jgi:hypothetical protein